MVQDFVVAVYRWLLGMGELARQFAPHILLFAAAMAAIWTLARRFDPEGSARVVAGLKERSGRGRKFIGFFLLVIALCGTLVQLQKMVDVRRQTIQDAYASRHKEPNLSGVVQFAPVVAVMKDKTYSRSLTLPPDFLARIGAEGVQVLSPYLSDPSSENVLKLVDSFKKQGQEVIFTRELTRRDEEPVAADKAVIKVDFQQQGTSTGRSHYECDFNGQYQFHNPSGENAMMRFAFALPQGGGIVQEFAVKVRDKIVTEPDENGLYAWEGEAPAGGNLAATVHYRVTGAGGFDYRLGSERRRIGDFQLMSHSTQPPQFAKSGIFPTSTSGNTAEWKLKDVLTSQSVALVFPRSDAQVQLFDKTLSILPLCLVAFAVGALIFVPNRSLVGVLSFGLGLTAIPVLSGYLIPTVSTLVGSAIAVALGGMGLGSRWGWLISLVCGASAAVFLTQEHGALAIWMIAGVATLGFSLKSRAQF